MDRCLSTMNGMGIPPCALHIRIPEQMKQDGWLQPNGQLQYIMRIVDYFGSQQARHLAEWAEQLGFNVKAEITLNQQRSNECGFIAAAVAEQFCGAANEAAWFSIPVAEYALASARIPEGNGILRNDPGCSENRLATNRNSIGDNLSGNEVMSILSAKIEHCATQLEMLPYTLAWNDLLLQISTDFHHFTTTGSNGLPRMAIANLQTGRGHGFPHWITVMWEIYLK